LLESGVPARKAKLFPDALGGIEDRFRYGGFVGSAPRKPDRAPICERVGVPVLFKENSGASGSSV